MTKTDNLRAHTGNPTTKAKWWNFILIKYFTIYVHINERIEEAKLGNCKHSDNEAYKHYNFKRELSNGKCAS